ncbi:MAG: type II toxin-antitoxin system RelE/ParE family toxin [Ruminococcus sp.]|nr:type II toxin-antitoxin system RelE/ParE family toxin [Ruminococcus sp.]
MYNKIKYSPEALNDLDEIWKYISVNLSNLISANNTINGILDTIDVLKEFPKSGKPLEFSNGIKTNYRFVRYKNYIAFYRISDNNIFVDRIIYGKRDYMKILFENEL